MNQVEQIMEEMRKKRTAKQVEIKEENTSERTARRGCGCGAID